MSSFRSLLYLGLFDQFLLLRSHNLQTQHTKQLQGFPCLFIDKAPDKGSKHLNAFWLHIWTGQDYC